MLFSCEFGAGQVSNPVTQVLIELALYSMKLVPYVTVCHQLLTISSVWISPQPSVCVCGGGERRRKGALRYPILPGVSSLCIGACMCVCVCVCV